MGYFKKLSLENYRNFSSYSIEFNSGPNIILGNNGSGKTNILESISLFEKGRGFRKEKIFNLINFYNQKKGFVVNSIFDNQQIKMNVDISNSDKNLKKISVNNSFESESIKHFESLFSIIHFLPEMERLFTASPSFRRNFLDRLIFSSDKKYNSVINSYKKSILERQFLLKKNIYDNNWLNKIESNIVELGDFIYSKRIQHINFLNKILNEINLNDHFAKKFILNLSDNFFDEYFNLAQKKEYYLSQIEEKRQNDTFSGGCSIGPHRSDIIGYNSVNKFNLNQLSTGQQKTIVLLIIVAQSEYLIKNLNFKPVILLDEICSHLDSANRELLLYLIDKLKVQVFMTGTEESFFSFLSTKANYCNID